MAYDSIPIAASNIKEFGRKKRVNRIAKLKQSKLDVRREQWLSQAKNKGCKEETKSVSRAKMPAPDVHARNDDLPVMKLEINPCGEENERLINHYSDPDSPSNSPVSSVFGSNRSPSHFTSNSSSSSSSSGDCCSESTNEEDDGDNDCLDDWETLADALAADEIKKNHLDPNLESPEPDSVTATMASQDDCCARAWRADDVFRPHSLPNLLKQNSFPCFKNVCSQSTCPICCEDLDLTDTSFLPCPCGYRLCLFCHKRILEDDGRCPGCRKQYDHHSIRNVSSSSKMGRSYTMIPRR